MFEDKSVWQIINMGGFTMYILLVCSVIAMAIILERLYHYHGKAVDVIKFMERIRELLEHSEQAKALKMCETEPIPVARVVAAGMRKQGLGREEITGAMDREIITETSKLEKSIAFLGTMGNLAVYIGLFGTVLGIVRAFHNISLQGSGGLTVVIGGVAEALICTATGLLVAVPSVAAFNYFSRKVDSFVMDMEYCSSETVDLLKGKASHGSGQ